MYYWLINIFLLILLFIMVWVVLNWVIKHLSDNISSINTQKKRLEDVNHQLIEEVEIRKQVEQDLKLISTCFQFTSEDFVIMDKNGLIKQVNPAFSHIFGYTIDEIKNKKLDFLTHENSDSYSNIWNIINKGNNYKGILKHQSKIGRSIQHEVNISPLFDESHKICGFVLIGRDVSHRLEMEDQVKQYQKMEAIGTLASGVAHDFNNILVSILGNAEIMRFNYDNLNNEMKDSVNQIIAGAKRAKDLVQQILYFSRRSNQKLQPIAFKPIIKEGIKFLHSTISPKIQIKTHLNSNNDIILGDPISLHQIIMNLATNAAQAMNENGGIMKITLENISSNNQENELLCLKVIDTGIGIEKKAMSHIFEPFFSTKKAKKGTGLGLSIVHDIVKRLNGTIFVTSEPQQGTCFELHFPVIEGYKDFISNRDYEPEDYLNYNVLCIDDEVTVLNTIKGMLNLYQCNATLIKNPKEALKILDSSKKFDFLITDFSMPEMTGLEMIEQIRAAKNNIPIILFSGYLDDKLIKKAEQLKVNQVLLKPIDLINLVDAIKKLEV